MVTIINTWERLWNESHKQQHWLMVLKRTQIAVSCLSNVLWTHPSTSSLRRRCGSMIWLPSFLLCSCYISYACKRPLSLEHEHMSFWEHFWGWNNFILLGRTVITRDLVCRVYDSISWITGWSVPVGWRLTCTYCRTATGDAELGVHGHIQWCMLCLLYRWKSLGSSWLVEKLNTECIEHAYDLQLW